MAKKKSEGSGNIGAQSIKKQVGKRFRQFREAIGKTQVQLGQEFKVYQSTITNIEVGKTFPSIKYLHHLGKAYRLNADWVVNNRGEMFLSPALDLIYTVLIEKYSELLDLMQVPVVEQLILARLEEIKVIAREDIEGFRALSTGTD
ncbi:MAG: helix-turn-helix transcriptional regulator [Candidatus Aminicenantes bacterium]|nr:MAG: helix-turn-helix transcriptional regulator [Candidatus Aminicenantes bacterium]